ncbi:MAG: hypothetical protein Q4G04_06260 [bacterium]|nr:hypothetical protein [bacterium]
MLTYDEIISYCSNYKIENGVVINKINNQQITDEDIILKVKTSVLLFKEAKEEYQNDIRQFGKTDKSQERYIKNIMERFGVNNEKNHHGVNEVVNAILNSNGHYEEFMSGTDLQNSKFSILVAPKNEYGMAYLKLKFREKGLDIEDLKVSQDLSIMQTGQSKVIIDFKIKKYDRTIQNVQTNSTQTNIQHPKVTLQELKNSVGNTNGYSFLVHGTHFTDEEVKNLIFKEGLRTTGKNEATSLNYTTQPLDIDSYSVEALKEKFEKYDHNNRNIVIIKLPNEYFNIYDTTADRNCNKTRAFMKGKVQVDGGYKYVLDPKFIVGSYNTETMEATLNNSFEKELTNETVRTLKTNLENLYKELGIDPNYIESISNTPVSNITQNYYQEQEKKDYKYYYTEMIKAIKKYNPTQTYTEEAKKQLVGEIFYNEMYLIDKISSDAEFREIMTSSVNDLGTNDLEKELLDILLTEMQEKYNKLYPKKEADSKPKSTDEDSLNFSPMINQLSNDYQEQEKKDYKYYYTEMIKAIKKYNPTQTYTEEAKKQLVGEIFYNEMYLIDKISSDAEFREIMTSSVNDLGTNDLEKELLDILLTEMQEKYNKLYPKKEVDSKPKNTDEDSLDFSPMINQLRNELSKIQLAYKDMLSDGYIDDDELATLVKMIDKVIDDGYTLKSTTTNSNDRKAVAIIIDTLEKEQMKMKKMQNGIEEIGKTMR